MPLIRKERAGSCPGHTWETDGAVVEVDAGLAAELLAIPGGGFSEFASEPDAPAADIAPDSTEVVEAPAAPKKRAARKPAAPEVTE